jgi:hypothetical protein
MGLTWKLWVVLGSAIAVVGCGGGGSSPTTPTATSEAPALVHVAPALGEEMGTALTAALTAADAGATAGLLERLLGIATLHAQASGFTAPCRGGGNTSLRYTGGRPISLSRTPAVFDRCGFTVRGRLLFASGTLLGTGTWRADQPGQGPQWSGSLDVSEIGPLTVDCRTTQAGCIGGIGGVQVGAPDTPPPPTPNTCTTAVDLSTIDIDAAGGTRVVTVETGASCSWTASSASFVSVSAPSGVGPGNVTLTIAANTGAERSATVTIAGRSVLVRQRAGGGVGFDGAYSGSFTGSFAGEGVHGPVGLSVSNGRITVTEPASGSGEVSGNGSANFSGGLGIEGISCSFTGTFSLTSGGGASADGGWECSGGDERGSGSWRATR